MWIIFGGKTRARVIDDGRKGTKHCPSCERATEWVECDVTDTGHLFFVELVSATSRDMVCTACGESMEPREWDVARRAEAVRPPPPQPPRIRARPSGPDDDIEQELAALKRKMK